MLRLNKIIIIIALLGLLPVFIICLFNIPGHADDIWHFNNMLKVKGLGAGIHFVFNNYFNYNGRYTDSVFWTIVKDYPIRFSYFSQFLALSNVSLLFISVIGVFKSVKIPYGFGFLIIALIVGFLPQLYSMLTWASGMGTYSIGTSCMLFMISSFSNYLFSKDLKKDISKVQIQALAFGIITIGSNEISLFISLLIWFFFHIILLHNGELKTLTNRLISCTILIPALAVIFAPGSASRQEIEGQSMENGNRDILASMKVGLLEASEYIGDFLVLKGGIIVLVCFFLFFGVNRTYSVLTKREGKRLLLLSVGGFIFTIIISFFVLRYALGVDRPLRWRAINPGFVISYLWLIPIAISMSNILPLKNMTLTCSNVLSLMSVLVILNLTLCSHNCKELYRDVYSGRARKQYIEVSTFYCLLKNSNRKDIKYNKLKNYDVFSIGRITSLHAPFWNRHLNFYFKKKVEFVE